MNLIKIKILFLILAFMNFYLKLNAQESYLIEKENANEGPAEESVNSEKRDMKPIKKNKIKDGADKNKGKSTLNKKKINESEIDNKKNETFILSEKNNLRLIYEPTQFSLNSKEANKIVEVSNKLNKEATIIIKSYASKKNKNGSSEARRLSLSRALEIRRIFIENGFPATSILVKALGSEKNNQGFTDIVVIEIN